MRKLALLLLLIATAVSAQEPVKGTICFDNDCTATTGMSLAVKPSDADRRFNLSRGVVTLTEPTRGFGDQRRQGRHVVQHRTTKDDIHVQAATLLLRQTVAFGQDDVLRACITGRRQQSGGITAADR